uniref:Ubiquitin-like domain-containing protein n=1 Tax=Astyanax mexicanus TaxID=7994 RepID=A0A8B9HF69_ASTMX
TGEDKCCVFVCVCVCVQEGVKTENNDHINLKVAGQDGSVVQFKIKRHTPLSKLMKAYCERQGLTMRQIRFRFDGQPINETDTPAQRKTRDSDLFTVVVNGFRRHHDTKTPSLFTIQITHLTYIILIDYYSGMKKFGHP